MKTFTDISYYEDQAVIENDVEYALERCKLDVAVPDNTDGTVMLYFHGGGMTCGEKFFPAPLLEAGFIVVSPNYRLSSERAKCPDYINDAAAAAAWTFRHIAEYGGNPDKIVITGVSAGGYLAAMVGMAPQYMAKFGLDNRSFYIIAPISGQVTTHFQILNERCGATESTGSVTTPAVVDDFAPLTYARKELPQIILITGDSRYDMPARAEENCLLDATLRLICGHEKSSCYNLAGFDHADIEPPAEQLLIHLIREIEQ